MLNRDDLERGFLARRKSEAAGSRFRRIEHEREGHRSTYVD